MKVPPLALMLVLPCVAQAQPDTSSYSSMLRAQQVQRSYPAPVLPFDSVDVEPEPNDNLARAIAEAYESNPSLGARRYELRATDDSLGIALSQVRPTV